MEENGKLFLNMLPETYVMEKFLREIFLYAFRQW